MKFNETVLLLIDIQMGAFDNEKITPIDNPNEFLQAVKRTIEFAKNNQMKVIYIQD